MAFSFASTVPDCIEDSELISPLWDLLQWIHGNEAVGNIFSPNPFREILMEKPIFTEKNQNLSARV